MLSRVVFSRRLCRRDTGSDGFRIFRRMLCTDSAVRSKRVLGTIAHINSGKTTTSEAMLYAAGALRRMGNVDAGDTTLDYLPDERERGITINAAAISFEWRKHQFFLVDSPGHLDFTYEVERALRVMDGVVVLVDAVAGVQSQTETVWRQADKNNLARIVFVNKMDRDGADFDKTVDSITRFFIAKPAVIQVPIFDDTSRQFLGAYDLLEKFESKASGHHASTLGSKFQPERLSEVQHTMIENKVNDLVETLADIDDAIMSLWIDGEPIPRELVESTLREACVMGKVVPVLCGSALRGLGVEELMDSVIRYLPSPLDRSPLLAKQVEGMKVSVSPSSKSPFLAYAFKVTHDKHRGRLVHFRAFSGSLDKARTSFFNTTKRMKESPKKLLRVLADSFAEVESVDTGDIFAAVGMQHTETGDTLALNQAPKSSHIVLDGVSTPPAVFSIALEVDSSSQENELEAALHELIEEDCSLETKVDEDTGETLLSGMGELHLQVSVERLSRALKFPVRMSRPRVSYRESASNAVTHVEHYDSMIGSHRLQANLKVSVEPLEGKYDNYENIIQVSKESFSNEESFAIHEGVLAAVGRGPLLGAPIVKTRVIVSPISNSEGDSKFDLSALRACAGKAVRNAVKLGCPKILEPVMQVNCTVPEASAGDVISEISHPTRRRGTILEVHTNLGDSQIPEHQMSTLVAFVPLEGMIGWATKMRSLTKGRGDFSARFSAYRPVDEVTQSRLISEGQS